MKLIQEITQKSASIFPFLIWPRFFLSFNHHNIRLYQNKTHIILSTYLIKNTALRRWRTRLFGVLGDLILRGNKRGEEGFLVRIAYKVLRWFLLGFLWVWFDCLLPQDGMLRSIPYIFLSSFFASYSSVKTCSITHINQAT